MSLNRVFVAGVTVATAADWNGLQAPWDTYTPTLTNITLGNGSVDARYLRVGKTILVRIVIAAGTTTTYAAAQAQVSLPVSAHATSAQVMPLRLSSSGGQYLGAADINAGGTAAFLAVPTAAADCRLVGMTSATPNPGTTGYLVIEGAYEAV